MPNRKTARRSVPRAPEGVSNCPHDCGEWHNLEQAMVHVGMNARWFHDNVTQTDQPAIPYHDMGLGRRRVLRFKKADLDAFVESRRIEASA